MNRTLTNGPKLVPFIHMVIYYIYGWDSHHKSREIQKNQIIFQFRLNEKFGGRGRNNAVLAKILSQHGLC